MHIKRFKLAMLGVLTGVFGIFAVGLAQAESLKIGIEPDYPPFSEQNAAGKLVGFDVDMAQALCSNIKVDCEVVIVPFSDLIPALKAGKIDAIISSMNDTPKRKKDVTFSARYYHIPTKMVKATNDYIDFSAKNIMGKSIGVEATSSAYDHLSAVFSTIAHIKSYPTTGEMYKDLVAKKVDFIVADSLALKSGFLDTKMGQGFDFFGPDLSDPAYYGTGASVAVKLGNQALADRFTAAITAIRKNGKYAEISNKYFGYDIYGL